MLFRPFLPLTVPVVSEPGLLEELARRVEDAEAQFEAQDLDLTLRDLEAAKQRQVSEFIQF